MVTSRTDLQGIMEDRRRVGMGLCTGPDPGGPDVIGYTRAWEGWNGGSRKSSEDDLPSNLCACKRIKQDPLKDYPGGGLGESPHQ